MTWREDYTANTLKAYTKNTMLLTMVTDLFRLKYNPYNTAIYFNLGGAMAALAWESDKGEPFQCENTHFSKIYEASQMLLGFINDHNQHFTYKEKTIIVRLLHINLQVLDRFVKKPVTLQNPYQDKKLKETIQDFKANRSSVIKKLAEAKQNWGIKLKLQLNN